MGQRRALLLLALLGVLFLAFAVGNDRLLGGYRLDLSREKLFTLSGDTHAVLAALEEPLELRFFFSYGVSRELVGLRNYARRVEEFLEEYVHHADGKLSLGTVDPEPFSEAEDEAAASGLQAVPVPGVGDLYFGLVGRSPQGEERILPFFSPDRERFLEYELTRLIYQLAHPEPVRVGLMSSLNMGGGFSPFGERRPWTVWQWLQESYDLRTVPLDADRIPEELQLLLLVHPVGLSPAALYAIDQFVLRGGKLLVFVDPYAEQGSPDRRSSTLDTLFAAWGVRMADDQILLDAAQALNVLVEYEPVRHLALVGMSDFAPDDPVTAQLEMVVFGSTGVLLPDGAAQTRFKPLLYSSDQSMLADSARMELLYDPQTLQEGFEAGNTRHVVAARVQGVVQSAFPEGAPPPPSPEEEEEGEEAAAPAPALEGVEGAEGAEGAEGVESVEAVQEEEAAAPAPALEGAEGVESAEGVEGAEGVESTEGVEGVEAAQEEQPPAPLPPHLPAAEHVDLVILADSDVLADSQWVNTQDFFGRRLARPWADNGNFVLNLVEMLGSGPHLVGIRSRGRYARPFTRVEKLAQRAESRLRVKEQELSRELEETEQRLQELEQEKGEGAGILQANSEQTAELLRFQEEKLRIRRELRQVRHDLNKDIEALGTRLKMLNILLLPGLLTVLALVLGWRRRHNWHRRLAMATQRHHPRQPED